MNPFVAFMASTAGRIIRALVGIGFIAWGFLGLSGAVGVVVAVVGAVMLAAGAFDFCLFAPLFGNPLSGQRIRAGK